MVPTDTEPPSGAAGSREGQRPTLRPEEVSETPQETRMAEPPEPEKPAEPLEPEPVKPQAAPEKVEDKKEASKTEAPEKVEDKKEAPKTEAPEKVEDKEEAPKIEAPEKVEDKKEAPKIEAPEKVEDKKEAPKTEAPEKVEDKKEAPKTEAPEKVEDKKEAPKTEEQREPDPKPQIDDEHPLQERVPLSPERPEPKEEVPGKDPKAEPKAAEKSGKAAKPSLFDRMMGFIVGKPSVPPPDPAGQAASAEPSSASAVAKDVVEQPAPAATSRSPEPPAAPPEPDPVPTTPVDTAAAKPADGRNNVPIGQKAPLMLPGLEDLDSVIARMASGTSNHLGLSLARSYMHMQASHTQLPLAMESALPPPATKQPKVEVPAMPPLPAPAEPPPDIPAQDLPLQELFKGRMRSLHEQERKELWSKSLQFDVAIVFPNPDFHEHRGLGDIGKNIFSILAGSSHCPDLAKVERGVGEHEVKRLYHDVLRDENASTEAAFLDAFRSLRPWIRGRGREEDWPQSTGGIDAASGQAKTQLRCLSHGGSFRRVEMGGTAQQGRPETDLEMGSPSQKEVYQHTLDPRLSSATDVLSLIRNSIVALLARKGLTVELVFSSDFKWIYALISAGEGALEELSAKHHLPRALDLESVDPEATEPCDDQYDSLAVAFQREGCDEVTELLKALHPNMRQVSSADPKDKIKAQDAAVREAYCWYLRSRLKGSSAVKAKKEANSAWGKAGEPWERSQPPLRNTWDRLCSSNTSNGPEVVRVSPGSAQARHCERVQVPRLDGKWVTSHFSREDRILLITAAVSDVCDVFKLINDGYVADILPCKGTVVQEQILEGQACGLQLAFRRQIGAWIAVPALFGIIAQVVVAILGKEQWSNTLLGYALLTSLWFSLALGAWKLTRKRLLLSRGDLPGSDGSFDICCGSGFVRPSDSADPRPFGTTRRQFYGGLKRSLITGEMEEQANPCFKFLRSALILLLCSVFAAGSVILAAATCDLLPLEESKFNIHQLEYSFAQHIVGLIVVLEIWLLNRFFRLISVTFTRWENHKTRSQFVHSYHLKALGLQLVNSYASLFYIAFYPDSFKMFEVSHSCSYAETWWNYWGATCRMARLNKQLITILAAYCLKVAFRCVLFKLLTSAVNPKASQSAPERNSDLLDLDRVMMAPRFGDPETDLNVMPSCCFNASSEVIVVLGMFILFFPASPWIGLLTFLFLQLSNLAINMAPTRRAIPWRAGYPTCHSVDLLEGSDRFACTAIQAISWLAMLGMAALLVWPVDLGAGFITSTLLGQTTVVAAPAAALLLLCRFLPGRLLVRCTPAASRLRTAETRLCRAMQKERRDASMSTARSLRSARGQPRLGTDFRVRTPQQWEDLSAKLTL